MSVGPEPIADPARRRAWLEAAVIDLGTGDVAFVEHALQRLSVELRIPSSELAPADIEQLLGVLQERAADIGAWGVLTLEALPDESSLSEAMREHLRTVIHLAIALGAYSYQAMTVARFDLVDLDQRACS